MKVIAHRGASGCVLENTLDAFERAVQAQADWIELDVRLLKDGTLAVFHDASLARLAGRPLLIESMSRATLADVSLNGGHKIPTLDEVFDRFLDRIPIIVEAKTRYLGHGRLLPGRILEEVGRHGRTDRVMVSSFQVEVLAELRKQSNRVRLGLLLHREAPERILRQAARLSVHSIHSHRSAVREPWLSRAHGAGYEVYVYTVDSEKDFKYFKELGVDGLFTNHPERLKNFLRKAGGRLTN